MISKDQIRKELADVKYYYSHKSFFDKAVNADNFLNLVKKYDDAVKCARPKLIEIYTFLYIEFYTQESAADKLCYTSNRIYQLNRELIGYFYEYFLNTDINERKRSIKNDI